MNDEMGKFFLSSLFMALSNDCLCFQALLIMKTMSAAINSCWQLLLSEGFGRFQT
jgi:hypothetical protein